jgi:C4-dicarboxylate-specific signal transduction histidine kinase
MEIGALYKNAVDGTGEPCSAPQYNMIAITFADDGPGIPKENFQKIFEPFFSTKDPTSGNGGEGLGLYIVWNILKIFNGTIQIDKDYRLGTKFMIQIQQKKEE